MDKIVANDWKPIIQNSLLKIEAQYLKTLDNESYLPKKDLMFSAFSLPLQQVKYVLLGESPYPRAQSANGYAFWDNDIDSIWSDTGFSKELNRATSLRNFIKMLLFARGALQDDFSQQAIARLDKDIYLQTISSLFQRLLEHGFLLLNSSLVYSVGKVSYHAKQWRPFIDSILCHIIQNNPEVKIILLGKISEKFANRLLSKLAAESKMPGDSERRIGVYGLVHEDASTESTQQFASAVEFRGKSNIATTNLLIAEHPYNVSFITNPIVNDFFKSFDLLRNVDV